MAITRYNRRRGLRTLGPLESFFDFPELYGGRMLDYLPSFFERDLTVAWHPSVDLYEDGENVYVKMDLPGLSKDDINISFDGHILSITGRREEEEIDEKNGSYWSRERFSGEFHRYVHIPGDVDSESLKARFKDGVLEVTLPKTEKARVKKIAIESGKDESDLKESGDK
jgi:HSP20 family protein